MAQCEINRKTVARGIITSTKNKLKDSGIFVEKADLFLPKPEVSDYQSIVDSINDSFGEQIIMPMNETSPKFAVTEPSDYLVTRYLNNLPEEVSEELMKVTKTPQFKAWFGDWELLKEAMDLRKDIPSDIFQVMFQKNPEQALFEGAIQANSSESEKEGAIAAYGKRMIEIAQKLYPDAKVGDEFRSTVGLLNEKGEPDVTDNMFTNARDEKKSIFNKGSFITLDNNISIQQNFPYVGAFRFTVRDGKMKAGEVKVFADNEYLNIVHTTINRFSPNTGTNTYLKLARFAAENNLKLRSDKISTKMSEASQRLWNRFVDAGQAEIQDDHYVFIGTPEGVSDNIYLSAGQSLSPEQLAQVTKLQNLGIIKNQPVTVDDRDFYKVREPDRLREIIRSKKIDYIHFVADDLVQFGELLGDAVAEYSMENEAPSISSKAGTITKTKVLNFLDKIGFRNIQRVNELRYKGQKLAGNAYVDMIDGIMQIVEGKEDYVLPEESMHILVELIKESDPALYDQMRAEIINYKVYGEVLRDPAYAGNKHYQLEDGSIDYNKIRDEAIAKLLTEFLINKLEDTQESARKLETVLNWWQRVVRWIRETFGNYKNPFKQALDAIDENPTTFGEFANVSSDDIFLSAKSNEQIDDETPDNRVVFSTIRNRPNELNIEKIGSDYFKDGNQVDEKKRVSALVDAFYMKLFGNRNFDEALEDFYEQSRKDGSYLHEILEEVINSWIDPVTGLMKKNPSSINFPLQDNPIQGKMVKKVENFVKKYLAQYSTGTRFLTEQVIYDKSADRYGTIDLLAVLPDGTIDIIDWKSMLLQDIEGAKDYKREGIFVQLNEYRRILREDYGFTQFGKLRAIPIKKEYKTDKDTKERKLADISIGNANPAAIGSDQRALRPIISPEESTGSDVKDELVGKLGALYQKYIDKGYFEKDRNILTDVQEAIYEIRVSNSVENLSKYFIDLRTKFEQLTKEEKALLDGKKEDIQEALGLIAFYEDILTHVVEPSRYLQKDPQIAKESRNKLYESSNDLSFLGKDLHDMRERLLDAQAKKQGIFGLLAPEKVVNLARRFFRSMGSQDIATVRYMYELVKRSYNKIDIAVDEQLKKLKEIKFNFDEWRKSKNLSPKDAIGMIVDYDKGTLHSKISKDFYTKREEVFENKNAKEITEFVKRNYNMTDYTTWYNDSLEALKKRLENTTYDTSDPKKDKAIKKGQIQQFEKNYNIFTSPITAFGRHNPRIWSRNIKEELWESNAYKTITAAGNEPLLEMYNFFVDKNRELAAVGAIKDHQIYTFLPNIRKDFATIAGFDESNFLEKIKDIGVQQYKDWRKKISVEDYELNYQGARDPFTGEKLGKRFVPFVSNISPEEQSFDVFNIYGLMTKEIYKERYLQENDEILRALVHIERGKHNLRQNKYGEYELDSTGKPKIGTEKGKNAQILEEHVRAVVNGETLQYDADYVIQFKLREFWNKTPLGKLYKFDTESEDYSPTSISATKFLLWLNTLNMKRILGVNFASAISNLFGGSFSSSKLYQKYLSKEDLRASWLKLTSGAFYATEDMKKNAALVDYFLPLLNNREAFKSSQLSVNEASKLLSQDWLMAPMRKTSEIVQLNIFLALIENTGVVNGELVNLRESAMRQLGYEDRYNLPEAERKAIEDQLSKKIEELKNQFGLRKMAQFKTIKEAGKDKVIIDIPGIDRNSESVAHLREISQTMSKDSLGEADEFDLANYKYSIWWRLFMTFKNWIPRMADVRFGEFRRDQAHQSYEYGRMRMFAKALSANIAQTIVKLVPIPYITGKASDLIFTKKALIQRAKEVYQEKIAQEKKLGKYDPRTFISQGEFIDRFIQGTESTFAELRTLMFMGTLLFLGLTAPDDDDDSEDKAYKALARRQINKLIDEVGFFYSPKSGIDIAGGGAPVFAIVKDFWYLGSDITEQFFGFTFENVLGIEKGEDMQESAKPIKRTFKMFPVLKEILTYLPAVDEETAKDWGVKINDRRGF